VIKTEIIAKIENLLDRPEFKKFFQLIRDNQIPPDSKYVLGALIIDNQLAGRIRNMWFREK